MRAVGAVVGALAAVSVGLAPNVSAAEVQSQQWYLDPMQVEQMWKASTGEGVKIAVLDTGVNPNTPSLKGQVLADEVPQSVAYGATDDYLGHGTTIAEMMVGTGAGGGIQGLAPGAKVVPYRVQLLGVNSGEKGEKEAPFEQALKVAADSDAKIINMSLGGISSEESRAAVNYAASKGKLLVAAVGNEGVPDAPARWPYVIGTGAINSSGRVSDFSEKSSHGFTDLTAPGEGLPAWCDETFRSYCESEGTSLATALVSAAAALIWSAHPDWTVNQVTRALIDTASRSWPKDKPSKYAGYGLIRPRLVLENPNYDAGAPDVDPLAKVNGGDVLAKAGERGANNADNAGNSSSAPSTSASAPSQAPEESSTGGTSAAGTNAGATAADDNNTLWITLGAAAAVLVIGVAGAAVLRARRAVREPAVPAE
ncbi:type VII secretion-associated serine protease [Streptomyces spinoverrucosus]|uniref:Type VII secretion-associated serine protease n=1 Tax=Streptomyces spinoverrucosus TaxID=284043 RepID=A0A4Y3VJQ6_9ACTN|nr:S8 family serine peptidase [Streptomyces spinoverrucosus]GEC06378.1 type VII secretion-associated serine protease [Streptomyces spinoverrucosus]GHB86950.1 type VII secretion-associated serine protease [Streptomyces spinoverrucosus]